MKYLRDMFKNRDMAFLCAAIAFLFGLLLVLFGFWKTLFLIALTIAGYYIGKRFLSSKEELKELLDRIIPPGRFR